MSKEAPAFIPGLKLSEQFYQDCVRPIIQPHLEDVPHSAALIGSGSEVLGFDTEMSSDHHWGPRVMIFLDPRDYPICAPALRRILSDGLPRVFQGYPTGFTAPDLADKGTQLLDYEGDGPLNHRVEFFTVADYIQTYLGFDLQKTLTAADWLSFPQQKLRTLLAGQVFYDDSRIDLEAMRLRFQWYPHDVWLYMLASCWMRIEQNGHLMGRAGYVEDEIGSALIGARLVQDLMRLCFLMERQYAPYAKWFGTAFARLQCAPELQPHLQRALVSASWREREENLTAAYEALARLHNRMQITEPLSETVQPFFDRPFQVISVGQYSSAITAGIKNAEVKLLAHRRLIGNVDLVSDNTDLLEDLSRRQDICRLFEEREPGADAQSQRLPAPPKG